MPAILVQSPKGAVAVFGASCSMLLSVIDEWQDGGGNDELVKKLHTGERCDVSHAYGSDGSLNIFSCMHTNVCVHTCVAVRV